ncbi:hypothetical protein MAR_033575 [Mya arenaria]|uniref:Uncharacterized protein n=1 Tax=Mya arenaria TaxID=6604 RepID=A0ABY7G9D9_MYAAR|nr:hypothetical protein MAR_033575 [Mya arenaria]
MGLSMSNNRVLELSTALGNNAIKVLESQNAVCPQKMKLGLFTCGAVENKDHNPSSTQLQAHCFNSAIHYQMELINVFQPLRGNRTPVLSNSYP